MARTADREALICNSAAQDNCDGINLIRSPSLLSVFAQDFRTFHSTGAQGGKRCGIVQHEPMGSSRANHQVAQG
jgi:hypothetical protein